jgi:hypothetical protein
MSATEPVETAAETAPVEPTPVVEETAPAPAAEVEAALLSKDPEVVAANLEKAEPVEAPAEPTTTEATTAEATGPAEETPAEPAPVTPGEKKEGSSLLSFIKKHVPNPKAVEKKGKAVETPAKTEEVAPPTEEAVPTIVEPAEEKPFEGGQVDFKTHGGFFGYVHSNIN